MHVKKIYADRELDEARTYKKFLLVRQELLVRNRTTAVESTCFSILDFAEFQALEMNPMTMKDWIQALDNQIIAHKRKVLIGKGCISHKQAVEQAEKEFTIYRKREMEMLESDFDKEIKKLRDKSGNY